MSLFELDQNFLNQLQGIIKVPIPQTSTTKDFGYQSQDGRITSLKLDNCGLALIPDMVEELTELKELNFSNNSFNSLSQTICNIQTLENLNLSGNMLKSIPVNIDKLQNLKILDLQRNNLTELPPTIFNLKQIHTLFLNDNPLANNLSLNIFNNLNQVRHLLSHFGGPLRSSQS